MKRAFLLAFAAFLAIAPGAAAMKNVVVTIAQIGEPLEVIAGGKARVQTLMGKGIDPHLYRLTRADVIRLTRADLILYNGLHLEAQMQDMMVRLSRRKPVVAVAESLTGLPRRSGETPDPHVWMDPMLWMRALDAAVGALEDVDQDNAPVYRKNASAYFAKMKDLDARSRAAVASIPAPARALVTMHDAFGYFGRAYGIDVLAIQGVSTESEAGIRKIEELVDALVARRIGAIFVETSVSGRGATALIEGAAARGHAVRVGGVLYSDALGDGRAATYLGMFDHNVGTIVRALGGAAGQYASIRR